MPRWPSRSARARWRPRLPAAPADRHENQGQAAALDDCSGALALGILMPVTLSGCRQGPDITVAGSYFPSWMASLVVGVLGTILFWRLFTRLGIDPYLGPRALVYV